MQIAILYDGTCRLCQRSIATLRRLDWLCVLMPVDFRNEELRKRIAADIPPADLDRSMHIRFLPHLQNKNCKIKTLQGFDAFRALSWYLPALWLIAPLLYLPGIAPLGRILYARTAKNRMRCAGGICLHRHA